MTAAFTLQAQQLSGTQEYVNRSEYGGSRYSIINWSVNYRIFEEDNSFYIELSNPKVTPSTSSQYGIPGNFYSKLDLGISTWPNSDPTAYVFSLNFTIKYPDGSSQEHNAEINRKNFIDTKNKFKNTNATASSFRITSVEKMMYNGGNDQKLNDLIATKKNGNSNNISNSNSNNPVTQTGTTNTDNQTENTTTKPLDNYDPNTGLYTNPMANYNNLSSSNNSNTTTQLINSATTLINQWSNQEQANNEAEEIRQLQRAEEKQQRDAAIAVEAAAIKAKKIKLVAARKVLLAKLPEGKSPLSYEAKEVSEVYFFVYSYNPNTLEANNPLISISNVFPIQKYSDGSWPFKAKIMEDISKTNKTPDLRLSGYYIDKAKAEEQQQLFVRATTNYDFDVKTISYAGGKSTNTDSNTDYWGNTAKTDDKKTTDDTKNKQETNNTEADYWGNPIKKEEKKPATPTQIKPKPANSKVELDFWGNPIIK